MPTFPGGTVTFLFTDIEGSTRLWEQYPHAMSAALARHDALLRQAVDDNSGAVFKTLGDGFCAAFATAPDALHAALTAQRALVSEVWEGGMELRVRMALHTGAVEQRDDDYFGSPLNRVARLLAIGHGGQILVSASAQELTRDTLPGGSSLQDAGEHRLRDLGRPEAVFQLLHPDLPTGFPPLRSLDNSDLPNNLPQQVTSFIGREKEIEAVKSLLSKTRLLTLTGSGGCGKTRLSLQVAADVLEDYPDGVWLVELASLAAPSLVPQMLAAVMGVREVPGESITKTLLAGINKKQMLLVLDNCEHVLEAAARLVDTVITGCPRVQVLVSSREALGIAGESAYRVPSLSLPDLKRPQTTQIVCQYEAVRLFIERASASKADFVVTNDNAPALASLCHRLDGIPLAIELAAARVRSLSVEQIAQRLDDRFRILTGGSRTALPRRQTLQAAIDWSYDLLEENQRVLLHGLSVFTGGWTLEAAEAVCADGGVQEWEVLDLLTALVDKSLVVVEEQGQAVRYSLSETVRQYAHDRLMQGNTSQTMRSRHRDYFLRMAEEAALHYFGIEEVAWFSRLDTEYDNLHAALNWCLNDPEGAEPGLRLLGALGHFWTVRSYWEQEAEYFPLMLAREGAQQRTAFRAMALHRASFCPNMSGNKIQMLEESIAIYQELDDKPGMALSLFHLGLTSDSLATRRALCEESLAMMRPLPRRPGQFSLAFPLVCLADIMSEVGEEANALSLYEECLALRPEIGGRWAIAHALHRLGEIAHRRGDLITACTLLTDALRALHALGFRVAMTAVLTDIARIAMAEGQMEPAVRILSTIRVLKEALDLPRSSDKSDEQDADIAAARAAMEADAFSAAWAEGQAMTLDQAVEYALGRIAAEQPGPLQNREWRIR